MPAEPAAEDSPEAWVDTARGLSRKPAPQAEQVEAGKTTTPVEAAPDTVPVERVREVPARGELAVEELSSYAGTYLVHVSSFRGTSRARDDGAYFQSHGFDVVIARVDLGEKGIWYRVYAGPFLSRQQAEASKIRLDENPRVRSTRITRVPGTSSAPNDL